MVSQQAFVAKNGLIVNTNLLTANASTGRIGANTASPLVTFQIAANDAIGIPAGNTGQRPTGVAGYLRLNTDTNAYEGFANGTWGSIGGGITLVGSQGDIFYNNTSGLGASANLVFTSGTTLSVPNVAAQVITTNQLVLNVSISTANTSAFVQTPFLFGLANSLYIQGINSNTTAIDFDAGGNLRLLGNSSYTAAMVDPGGGLRINSYRAATLTSAANVHYDCANGNVQQLVLAANVTIDAVNIPSIAGNTVGGFYALAIFGGGHTVTWTNQFWFPGGVSPVQSGGWDVYTFVCFAGAMMGVQAPNMSPI